MTTASVRVIRNLEQRAEHVAARLGALREELGAGPIALFGAGAHTAWLLERFGGELPGVAFVLDDDLRKRGESVGGVGVRHPASVSPNEVSAVIASSDVHERAVATRAAAWAAGADPGPAVVRLYEGARVEYGARPAPDAMGAFRGVHRLSDAYLGRYSAAAGAAGMDANDWRTARFYNLVGFVRATAGVEGATLEAGCYRGLSSLIMCETVREMDPGFDGSGHVIVDSFEGLSEPVAADGASSVARHGEGAFADTSVERVRETLAGFPGVEMHRGWIPDVLGTLPERRYRFVHLDLDLYEPISASLEYFYPRVSPGGVILVDDYGPMPNGSYPGCAAACRAFGERRGVWAAPLSAGNAVFIKRP